MAINLWPAVCPKLFPTPIMRTCCLREFSKVASGGNSSCLLSREGNTLSEQPMNKDVVLNNCSGLGMSVHEKAMHTSPLSLKSKKQRKSKPVGEEDSDEEMVSVEDEDEGLESNSKVAILTVSSLRMDNVLRTAFQIARNKIEILFYESRLRVNGYKVVKKSHNVALGDEIDIIKGFSPVNPKCLLVNRIKVLGASETQKDDSGNFRLKIRKFKNLMISNYEENEYKESTASD